MSPERSATGEEKASTEREKATNLSHLSLMPGIGYWWRVRKPTNLSTMTWLFRLLNMILITETFYLSAINEEFWQLKIAEWWNLLICRWMEKRMGWIIRNYLYIIFVVLSSGATVVLLPCKRYPFTSQKQSFCNTSVVQLQAKGVHL